eukprot:scaffold4516_cov417-Prasinococcus_capsulatus_cf.AAC.27
MESIAPACPRPGCLNAAPARYKKPSHLGGEALLPPGSQPCASPALQGALVAAEHETSEPLVRGRGRLSGGSFH